MKQFRPIPVQDEEFCKNSFELQIILREFRETQKNLKSWFEILPKTSRYSIRNSDLKRHSTHCLPLFSKKAAALDVPAQHQAPQRVFEWVTEHQLTLLSARHGPKAQGVEDLLVSAFFCRSCEDDLAIQFRLHVLANTIDFISIR